MQSAWAVAEIRVGRYSPVDEEGVALFGFNVGNGYNTALSDVADKV